MAIDLSAHSADGLDRDLYLLARELISNVERHAGADRASFSLQVEDSAMVLEVRDFGRGFERAAVRSGSVGLRSVEQRVADLGGSLLIESVPNQGTTVTASIPLQR
ncbi:MAG: ATP-binding protein [Chloroflexi bacterium]|nr:ATP-binding protein [Chloroflexota bacterium]